MGGSSAEREVSIKTGTAVLKACEELGHKAIPVDFYDDYQPKLAMLKRSDIVFNALHGTIGEDGTIQLWLEENNIPFTGSDSDSSRLCMNKDKSKEEDVNNQIRKFLKIVGITSHNKISEKLKENNNLIKVAMKFEINGVEIEKFETEFKNI